MIFVDSSVWVDFYRADRTPEMLRLRELIADRSDEIVIGDLVLLEVLQGYADERRARIVEADLTAFEMISMCNPAVALAAAQHYRHLRGIGATIRKTIDTIIATRCIMDGHALLHRDRDFRPFVEHLGLIDAMDR